MNVGGSRINKEALQIEPTDSLLVKATHFLRDNHILNPAEATLKRTIYEQRKKTISPFHQIKNAPQKPSVAGMRLLSEKLSMIEQTGALHLRHVWVHSQAETGVNKIPIYPPARTN